MYTSVLRTYAAKILNGYEVSSINCHLSSQKFSMGYYRQQKNTYVTID